MNIKLIAAVICLGALATLTVIRFRKGKKKPDSVERCAEQNPGPAYRPVKPENCSYRTMLLSYTTLILTEMDHPAKKYRAELFAPVTLGRSPENRIILSESSVSRHHLKIYRSGAFVYAENLNSKNGTLLNGKQLKAPEVLVSGSILQLGRLKLRVEID